MTPEERAVKAAGALARSRDIERINDAIVSAVAEEREKWEQHLANVIGAVQEAVRGSSVEIDVQQALISVGLETILAAKIREDA